MLKQTFRLVMALCLPMLAVQACARASADTILAQSLLWRVTASNGNQSHVYGTIHIADTLVFRQRDTVVRILDASRTYASELNLDSVMSQLRPAALILAKGTLYDLFDSADVDQICRRLTKSNSMLGSACTRLKPGAIMMIVSMSAIERTAPSSIDEFLWSRAKKIGLERFGLETVAEQLQVVDSMPPSYVLEQLRDLDSLAKQVEQMRRLYADEDLAGLYRSSNEDSGMDEQMLAMLNDRRNARMVDRMEPLLASGGAFIAIGALHLTGPSSIPDILRKRGYRVEPVLGGSRGDWLKLGGPGKRR